MEKEQQYIINESPEVSIGEVEGWTSKIFTAFPALKHKNYQLYFSGQLVSLIGTWLQIVAQGWLVFTLTKSAYLVGFVAACGSLPILIFALFGGVLVDRYPKKKILLFTQSSSMILAFVLAGLTLSHMITVPHVAILAFLLGCVDALDKPARQAFAVEMVGKEDLTSAIALNAGIFNSARAIGPAVAGIIIAFSGTGWAFLFNAVSYIFVLWALFSIDIHEEQNSHHLHPLKAIKEGLVYSFSHPLIKMLLFMTTISAAFGWTYATLMPVMISDVFHLGASSLGYFYAATGIGALVGTIVVSLFHKRISAFRFIVGGNMLFSITIVLFTLTQNIPLTLLFLFLSGLGLIAQFSTINSLIQHLVPDQMRGRVLSIYVLMFMGMVPFGNFEMGVVAQNFGAPRAIQIGAGIVFLAGLYFYSKKQSVREAYETYKNAKL